MFARTALIAIALALTPLGCSDERPQHASAHTPHAVRLFLAGDVMTGRAIDQILPVQSDPVLHEPNVHDARVYLALAVNKGAQIALAVDCAAIWGDALSILDEFAPQLRFINLETSITTSDAFWPRKPIHYRMHPDNARCLNTAGIDLVTLANNHVLDFDRSGLDETLDSLDSVGVRHVGAGRHRSDAAAPAIFDLDGPARLAVFAYGMRSAGIPPDWVATDEQSGLNWLADLSDASFERVRDQLRKVTRNSDIVVVSLHWGGNWGYQIRSAHQTFAHRLIDEAGVDIVHGHSSHHPLGIEVYGNRLILYGSGDLLNDYEGIGHGPRFRPELSLMYFPDVEADTGKLLALRMVPTRIANFRVNRADAADAQWLADMLNREGASVGTRVAIQPDGTLALGWNGR
ncbi:MAG: CapA family protein [Chromatiales bacterium]|nr:CapA family protein [Chromatiales bacterium]